MRLPRGGRLCYALFCDEEGEVDDVILAAYEDAGGEVDVIDVSCHGGQRVVERVLLGLSSAGAEAIFSEGMTAQPASGSIDVRQLAYTLARRAVTRRGLDLLLRQATLLPRELSRIAGIAEAGDTDQARHLLRGMISRSRGARLLYAGAEIAIVGPVNAGKSSLANRLAGRNAAIVTDLPGTTRDWVSIEMAIEGVPLRLIDTAGIRAPADELERMAIEHGQARVADADVYLLVFDSTTVASGPLSEWRKTLPAERTITIANKADLAPHHTEDGCEQAQQRLLHVSAKTGQGITDLTRLLMDVLGVDDSLDVQAVAVTPELCGRLEALAALSAGDLAASLRGLLTGGENPATSRLW